MLAGAGLEPKFWPYYFHHFHHHYNVTPHWSHDASPFTMCSGCLPDLSLLHTFGCQFYVLPPHATCHNKLCSDTHTGIFLGYSQIMKNILYYDLTNHQVKTALHLVFDDAMTDLDNKTPNAQLLCGNTVLPSDVLGIISSLQYLDNLIFPISIYYVGPHSDEIRPYWSIPFWYWTEYMWPSLLCLHLSLPSTSYWLYTLSCMQQSGQLC